jgi:hypothetical protein
VRAATTSAEGATFGTMWRRMIRVLDAPSARVAVTNSRSRSDSVSALTTRASRGQEVSPNTTVIGPTPLPKDPTANTARKNRGTDCTTSITRLMKSSTKPPRKPATTPAVMPTTVAMMATPMTIMIDVFAPCTTLVKRSRPS